MTVESKVTEQGFDAVTRAVRKFYESNPYPRPEDSLDPSREAWAGERRRAEFHLHWPARRYRDDLDILIAGCGTFQAAKFAMRWPSARVTGIDISRRSIEETARLRRQHGLDNLTLRQMRIEDAAELGAPFDLIVSTGVLHHLPDPDAGLRALRETLAPGGAVNLMVYAPYGRTGIYMLQDYCRLLGLGTMPSAIRDLAATLEALPPDHPLVPLLRDAPDFRSYAGVADALLNPQDRAYSVGQFLDFVRGAGLCFGRWLRQAPYRPECGAPAATPHARALRQLPETGQYAAMELFRGTMVRHSALLYRSAEAGEAQRIDFDRDGWQDYVPVRLPHTGRLAERLPDGAAAVLLNRNHGYADLALPIDAAEERMVDAIDGMRSIAEIAKIAAPANPAKATRALFRKLWLYDQIVFDTSR